MATCSICSEGEATSALVNELLEKKTNLDEIAAATGFHRSSIHRHKAKCFAAWKAARIKAKRGKTDAPGRMIVSWPNAPLSPVPLSLTGDRTFTYYGDEFPESELRPTDDLFVVTYAKPHVEQAHDAALRENAKRGKSQAN